MKKWGVGIAAAVLLLTGCASSPTAEVASEPGQAVEAAPITQAPTAAAEDKVADPSQADYLFAIKAFWKGTMPTDTDLLGAGELACDGLRAGQDPQTIVAVAGDDDDARSNNGRVVTSATQYLCPEFF